jgi:hypothetical protein
MMRASGGFPDWGESSLPPLRLLSSLPLRIDLQMRIDHVLRGLVRNPRLSPMRLLPCAGAARSVRLGVTLNPNHLTAALAAAVAARRALIHLASASAVLRSL